MFLFYTIDLWKKVLAGIVTALMLMTTTFLSFNFIQITNPEQIILINSFISFYQIGTWAFWITLFAGLLVIILIAINAMKSMRQKKKKDD